MSQADDYPPGYAEIRPTWRPNGAGAPIAPLPVVCAASLAGKDVPRRQWIVQDMIPDRTVTLVSGDGGVGLRDKDGGGAQGEHRGTRREQSSPAEKSSGIHKSGPFKGE